MARKHDLAEYLVSLISIMTSKETAGLPRGNTLSAEYNRVYEEFTEMIKKEHPDETR